MASRTHTLPPTHNATLSTSHLTCSVWVQCRSERGRGRDLLSSSLPQHIHWMAEADQEEIAEREGEWREGEGGGVKGEEDDNSSKKQRDEDRGGGKWPTSTYNVCTSTKCLYAPELTVHSTGSSRLACSAWPSTTECCGCGQYHMTVTCQSRDCHMQHTYLLRSAGSTMSVEISASRIEIPVHVGKMWCTLCM